jgi:uncharacterized membrane protein
MKPRDFERALDDERIVAAIHEAESRTRAEIRVHVARREAKDAWAAGAATFEKLGMTSTAERNGVLLFVAPASQSFSVIGDRAIHEKCPPDFWESVVASMREDFRQGRFTEGIVAAVATLGELLARHFPRRAGEIDRNELPDAVSRD